MFTRAQFMELTFAEKKEVMDLRAKFHAKKSKATAEMERIPKNGYNDFHKYHYARESDVKDKIRQILFDNKISFSTDLLSRNEVEVKTSRGMATKTDVQMLFALTDFETGYFEEYMHDGVAVDNSDKGIYKVYSNTIKYFLMDQFLIPTGDDVEKDSPEIQPKNQQQNNQQQQSNQQKYQNKNQNKSNQSNQNPEPPPEQTPDQSTEPEQKPGEPVWKQIMSMEDKLVEASKKEKSEVRQLMRKEFGDIGKYKDLEPAKAAAILKQLHAWVDFFLYPQG